MQRFILALTLLAFSTVCSSLYGADKLKVLIIDGQNNHDWKATTPVLQRVLEGTGRFSVMVSTTPAAEIGSDWQPKFSDYDAIVSNYNGQSWPEAVRKSFAEYVRNGGGFVCVHAADNSFGDWAEYNEMIGVGGWNGRNEKSGPMLYWQEGKIVRDESSGAGGTHGANHEFVVETRVEHPIMHGLPPKWKHASDELYAKLRGPATNLTVIATAFSAPDKGGTGKNEPILMVIDYGKGRVFHTVLGHDALSMFGIGFQVTLTRGTEWVATGNVTLPPPKPADLPADKVVTREPSPGKPASDVLVPLEIKLPSPVFMGTPKDIQLSSYVEPLSDKPRPLMMVPAGLKNIAKDAKFSSSDKNATAVTLQKLTDGDKGASDQSIFCLRKGTQWLQMDYGAPQEIFALAIWHAHNSAKVYRDVVVQVADDPDFIENVRTIFNNDQDNSSGLGVGTDREYFETNEGKLINAKGIKARSIRVSSKGSTESVFNENTEIEVYGRPAS